MEAPSRTNCRAKEEEELAEVSVKLPAVQTDCCRGVCLLTWILACESLAVSKFFC